MPTIVCRFFFFNDTATTEIYTLSLHDALPISIRKRSHELPAVAGLDRVRRVDDHLALKQAGVLADQLLDRVEPHREHDDVGIIDRLFHGRSTRVLAELLRDRVRLPSPVTDEDHPLAAVGEVPRYCRPDLPNSDDCCGHSVLFFWMPAGSRNT